MSLPDRKDMTISPEISCIIPAFENVHLLSRCLLSVLTQKDIEAEVLVCDDSHSNSVAELVSLLCMKYPQLRYIPGARSGNPVSNWNVGIQLARGTYCVVIHHDEFLISETSLHDVVCELNTRNCSSVVAACRVIGLRKTSRFHWAHRIMKFLRAPLWTIYLFNWIGPTGSVFFRRANGAMFDETLVYLVDVDFYFRLFEKGLPYIITSPLVASLGHHSRQITAGCNVPLQRRRDTLRIMSNADRYLTHIQKIVLNLTSLIRGRIRN